MPRLVLLRHAKSRWDVPGTRDHERPLASRGQDAAPRIGRHIAEAGLTPDRVVCSTALRTRQTLDLIVPAFAAPVPTAFEADIYEAEAEDILAVIRAVPDGTGTLLVIGHNPGLEDLAHMLAGEGEREARALLGQKFPTAAYAALAHEGPWARLGPSACRLEAFVTPKSLDEA